MANDFIWTACPDCGGSGACDNRDGTGDFTTCSRCEGRGEARVEIPLNHSYR